MSLVEERLEALGKDLEAWDGPGTAPPERLGDRFRELVARLMANLENINPEEQAALIAAASAMIAAFGTGNFFGGFLAFLEFLRLYRKAIKPDVAPSPA